MLGLPSSMAWLGWVGGLLALLLFFVISLWCALMLTDVYMVRLLLVRDEPGACVDPGRRSRSLKASCDTCMLVVLSLFRQVNGRRHTRYKFAVASILGPRHSLVLSIAQHANMVLTTIGYSIAAADSMSYVAQRICAAQGTPLGHCFHSQTLMSIIFVSAWTYSPADAVESVVPGMVWLWAA